LCTGGCWPVQLDKEDDSNKDDDIYNHTDNKTKSENDMLVLEHRSGITNLTKVILDMPGRHKARQEVVLEPELIEYRMVYAD
jgi:hypothetical protein